LGQSYSSSTDGGARGPGIAIGRLQKGAGADALGTSDPAIEADAGFGLGVHPTPSMVLPGHGA